MLKLVLGNYYCYFGIIIIRKKLNLSNGVGVVLQPLNDIPTEKTKISPSIPTAYQTMTGEGMKSGNETPWRR